MSKMKEKLEALAKKMTGRDNELRPAPEQGAWLFTMPSLNNEERLIINEFCDKEVFTCDIQPALEQKPVIKLTFKTNQLIGFFH
jgi:hypothetical protein